MKKQALQNFKNAMPILRMMMKEQAAFTTELLDKVRGCPHITSAAGGGGGGKPNADDC